MMDQYENTLFDDTDNDQEQDDLDLEGEATDGSDEHAPDGRLIIKAIPGRRRAIQSRVLQALRETGSYFEQAGGIVVLELCHAGAPTLKPLTAAGLMAAIDDVIVWSRWDHRTREFTVCDVPEQFCTTLFRVGFGGVLPPLRGLAHQPYFRPDGSLCSEPGYDPSTGLYGTFRASEWASPGTPTRDDAEAALGLLGGLLKEFPFASPTDRSAALCALLTAAVRVSLPNAPMFHVRAHQPGTGKSYLSALITAMATSKPGAPLSFPGNNNECERVLLAALLQRPAVIEFDNLTGDIFPFNKLCTTLTSETIQGRRLRHSEVIEVSTRTLVLSSGNNVGPIADMVRRCITINLDSGTERPETRQFSTPNLLEQVHDHRPEYVGAALRIVAAWLAAGSPRTSCTPLNSFNAWSDWCRQPLLWLGQADPVEAVSAAQEEDPDRVALSQLLTLWHELAGDKPVMVRDLISWAGPMGPYPYRAEQIQDLLEDVAGAHGRAIDRRRLGWWLKRHTGHIVNGLRLVNVERKLNSKSWRVVKA